MKRFSVCHRAAGLCLFITLGVLWVAPSCLAVDTRTWEESDQADFARGTAKGLSIKSNGRLTLAPIFKELDSTSVPYLWAIAQDSKGTVYYAGGAPTGATTKILALPRAGKPTVFATIPGLEVHALAIDKEDRVYAAVLPDAKVYRIDATGKAQLFFDPKCKYIWAMAFDKSGNLFVATGDSGLIYKVTGQGTGSKFFDTQETHARSMIIDEADNLIVGTEPGGLILRITPAAKSFVLYQAAKREITSVAKSNGMIYAAAIGAKPSGVSITGPSPVLPAAATSVAPTGAPRAAGTTPSATAPAVGSFTATVVGGSDLYRIHADGFAERIWNSPNDLVYAIAFDQNGMPIVGTGNKGTIYRVDSDYLSTELINAPPTQVTAFLAARDGVIYASTGNVGNLYAIGPALADRGTLESDVLDAGEFSYWGKAHITAVEHGGSVELETRSGNVNNPQSSWSAWSPVSVTEQGGPVKSPPARFLQYRLTISKNTNTGESPEISAIDFPFLSRNIAPKITQTEVAPFNYRQPPSNNSLDRSVAASGSPLTLTLSAVGQKKPAPLSLSSDSGGGATLQYSKGFLTARWSAVDANADPLSYTVEIRPVESKSWQLLKEKLTDRFYAFDTAAFPDGKYVIRITASDSPGNPPGHALKASRETEPFTIDNTSPEIVDVSVSKSGSQRQVTLTTKDALSWIDKAEYSLNGAEWVVLQPEGFVTDSQTLRYTIAAKEGQALSVRVFDENDNSFVKQIPLP